MVQEVEKSPGKYFVHSCTNEKVYENTINQLWFVIKSLSSEGKKVGQRLSRGQILRLGRISFMIKDLKVQESEDIEEQKSKEVNESPTDISDCNDVPKSETEACRICAIDENTPKNPLLAPCKCTGTMKFIHYQCLKYWLNKKLTAKKTDNVALYSWKTFECEVCKTVYPCNSFITP
eukprot:TRINITY_DN4291_c0_g1_i9.p2 TRINITY_DN4291_c0_g1~~TRINITY_DN4291_c0_g1_i9.p2  ORF type:complete len:177 (-),score=31.86 TRINITY_DN4291_c0_g1_i9:561-1091(-)